MKKFRDDEINAFLALAKAGLWEKEVRLLPFEGVDFALVNRLAFEQSVVGLVAAGLEHVQDVKIPKDVALSIAGVTLQLEHRNKAMNEFVAKLMQQLRDADVNALLVKGQGIAQCYERPLWRSAGDVDLLLVLRTILRRLNICLVLRRRLSVRTYIGSIGLLRLIRGRWSVTGR